MRPVLFVIPEFGFKTYAGLILVEIIIAFLIYIILKIYIKNYKKLGKEIINYLIFVLVLTTAVYIWGPVPLRTYGVCVALGFVLSIIVAQKMVKKEGIIEKNIILDLSFYVLIGTILGARLFYFLFYDINYFLANPLKFFAIWEGGMVYYGGLIGGISLGYIFLKKRKVNILKIADVVGVVINLGYFIGRWGCFGYGCCYGKVCSPDFPLGVKFPAKHYYGLSPAFEYQLSKGLVKPDDNFSLPVYPTQLFESFAGLIIFVILFLLWKRKKFDGQIAALSLIFYGIARFVIEFFRINPVFLFLTVSQWISILMIISGIIIYYKAYLKNGSERE